ncbi:MAG: PilZ domain-containing protein [Candidatus Scalindua sp.]
MGEEEKRNSGNRDAVRIHDSFPIKYNIITQKEYDKKESLYISRRTINRSAGKRKEAEAFSFDWSSIEDEEDFDPLLVKILFHLDQKINVVLARQDEILKKITSQDHGEDIYETGECIDISGTGINMLIPGNLNKDTLLELNIEPPIHPAIQLIALGKVARVCPSKDKEMSGYEISIAFTAINEDDREMLIKYIFQRQHELISSRKRSDPTSTT